MSLVRLEQVLELAEQLEPTEQMLLVERLLAHQSGSVTRAMLLAEFERRKRLGLFAHEESLYGKYAEPYMEISAEELDATIRQAANEWENELDDLADTP